MPATVDNNPTSEVSPTRRDSTFSYEPSPLLHSTDIRIASEQIRKASIDSGVNMLPSRTSISPMSRVSATANDQSLYCKSIIYIPSCVIIIPVLIYKIVFFFCRRLQIQNAIFTLATEIQHAAQQV